jgi:hypothetical protein
VKGRHGAEGRVNVGAWGGTVKRKQPCLGLMY